MHQHHKVASEITVYIESGVKLIMARIRWLVIQCVHNEQTARHAMEKHTNEQSHRSIKKQSAAQLVGKIVPLQRMNVVHNLSIFHVT